MSVYGNDHLRVCPIDASHVIKMSRFLTHVYKCARSKSIPLYECPYNKQHLFTERAELGSHVKDCPSNNIGRLVPAELLMPSEPIYTGPSPSTLDNTNDAPVGGTKRKSNFYVTPSLLLPSERKAFYKIKRKEYLEEHPECDLSSGNQEMLDNEMSSGEQDSHQVFEGREDDESYAIDEWPLSDALDGRGCHDEYTLDIVQFPPPLDDFKQSSTSHNQNTWSDLQPTPCDEIDYTGTAKDPLISGPTSSDHCCGTTAKTTSAGSVASKRVWQDRYEFNTEELSGQHSKYGLGSKPLPLRKENAFQLYKYGYEEDED